MLACSMKSGDSSTHSETISPGSYEDVRPISMTTLWSKILEIYVATFTIQEQQSTGAVTSMVGGMVRVRTMF